MRSIDYTLLRYWHNFLGLRKQTDISWHEDRLREELQERREAPTLILKLSETSDVFFSISRARYDGYIIHEMPALLSIRNTPVYAYILGKFTSRCLFYRTLAFLCGAPDHGTVREVVNPKKDGNLEQVATRHRIDPEKFKRVGRRLRWIWPLLP